MTEYRQSLWTLLGNLFAFHSMHAFFFRFDAPEFQIFLFHRKIVDDLFDFPRRTHFFLTNFSNRTAVGVVFYVQQMFEKLKSIVWLNEVKNDEFHCTRAGEREHRRWPRKKN